MNIRELIHAKMERAIDLPTLPQVVIKVEKLARDENASAKDLAEVMNLDPALTARVLKIANSVIYGGRSPISSVSYAVARIGFSEVRNIALSLSILKLFHEKGQLDYRRFWKHCLSVAFASRIVKRFGDKDLGNFDNFFVVGLLHDVGIMVLDQYFSTYYAAVLAEVRGASLSLSDLEKDLLGIDHAEVGAMLLEKWRLPDDIVQAVRYHHSPHMAPWTTSSIQVVHLSNFICNNQGLDNGIEAFPSGFCESSWDGMGLSVDNIPEIIKEVNEETAKSEMMVLTAN